MEEERWERIQEIFCRAVDLSIAMPDTLPGEEHQAILLKMCDGDASLLEEVSALLVEDRRANPLLDSSLEQTARAMLEFGPLPSMIQQQIGPYRLLELLGEGGMGVVYLAERTDIGGRVAIKLLRDAWLSPMRRERFRFEQLTLAQFNHPSIARIYDSNTLEDGTPWFVMEYANGLPLTEYWQQNPGTVRECIQLFRRVCEAVQYAHSRAIIHRDLKPSNILVTRNGDVKLLDFGIAKQLNAEETEPANRTITGLRMMTLAYASPEQITGGPVGTYSDVYALGVLLYELLTGQLPHQEIIPFPIQSSGAKTAASDRKTEKPSAVLRRTRATPSLSGRKKSQPRNDLNKAEWADLDLLTLKALEADPNRRYPTADALTRDLDALLAGRPLEARPNSLAYTLGKFAHRNRRVLISLAAMFLLIAGTIVFYTVRLTEARNAAVQEAARTLRLQQFTESLFDGGDTAAGPAKDLRALDLLDRGRKEAASLSADPEMQADMNETLGSIYQKLGKLDMADPLLTAALDERKKALGTDHRNVAESLVALGLLRKDQGKLDEAEALVRQGLEIDRKLKADTDTMESMVALGAILDVHGKYDEARKILEEALKMRPKNEEPTAEKAENLTELADANFYLGRYDASEALNNQALAIDRQLFGEQHPSVAQDFNNLGAIEDNRGNYTAAEANYRKALAITEAWYGSDHPETAANLTALAQELSYQKRDAEAQTLLERALVIQQHVNGPVTATVATTLNQIGILAYDRHDYEAARDYFTQARDTYKHLYGDSHPAIAVAYSNLGSVCLDEKNYPCAEKMYREAVRRLDTASPASVNDAVAHLKLGRALLRDGRFKEAEPETLSGYKYLVKQMAPTNGFLSAARKDLALIYDGLHENDEAAHYRTELSLALAAKH